MARAKFLAFQGGRPGASGGISPGGINGHNRQSKRRFCGPAGDLSGVDRIHSAVSAPAQFAARRRALSGHPLLRSLYPYRGNLMGGGGAHLASVVRPEMPSRQIDLQAWQVEIGINFLRMNKIGIQSVNTCHCCSKSVQGAAWGEIGGYRKHLITDNLLKWSRCKCFQAAAMRMSKSAAKLATLQPVTAFKTFVPCVELKISARVANETKFGPGAKHEGNEIGCRRSVDHSCKHQAGGALRRALPPCASCGVKRWQDRVFCTDAQCFGQRGTFCRGSRAESGFRYPFFNANAWPGAGRGTRYSGSLHRTCGTLLLKPTSVLCGIHDRRLPIRG